MSFDRIVDKVRQWGRPWASGSEPLEIHRAILEDIQAQSVAAGGGRRVFPFDRVEVKLFAATPEEKVRLEGIVEEAWNMPAEASSRLRQAGVRVPEGLAVTVEVVEQAEPGPGGRRYAVSFARSKPAVPTVAMPAAPGDVSSQAAAGGAAAELDEDGATPVAVASAATASVPPPSAGPGTLAGSPTALADPSPALAMAPVAPAAVQPSPSPPPGARRASGRPLLRLTVLKGQAARTAYEVDAERLFIGRLEEVVDGAGRVRRRNDVAFVEEGDINQTVSREHARIAWDAESASYWLRDEGSSSGTVIFRAGRSIEVSRHDRRGVRLASGDEVYLGRAALRVEV